MLLVSSCIWAQKSNLREYGNAVRLEVDGTPFLVLGAVHEVTVLQDASFRSVRSLNGDQTHQGRHVRISVGDWKALHVRLYRYR